MGTTQPLTTETTTEATPLRIGILGANGSTGTELIQQLQHHPQVALAFATSRSCAGRSLREVDPAAPDIILAAPEDVDLSAADLVFVCLPHGTTAAVTAQCLEAGARVVDLSGDLRLRSEGLHQKVYGTPRAASLAKEAVYGLTEYHRDAIRGARLVSNPGCYPTCTMLALGPLARSGLLQGTIVIDAKSGISGAGRKPSPHTHFCMAVDDIKPYKLGRAHRHTPEIEQAIHVISQEACAVPQVIFNPHTVPLERGMLTTIVAEVKGARFEEIRALYQAAYEAEPFVTLLPAGQSAQIRAVARTNRAVIGLAEIEGSQHIVLTSAIDNLQKGAAGQAIQNMNVMMGMPETMGLLPSGHLFGGTR